MKTEISAIENALPSSIGGVFFAVGDATLRDTRAQPRRNPNLSARIAGINCLIYAINRLAHECFRIPCARYRRVTPDAILPRVGFLLEIKRPC
jgi:hypothetical protein